MRDERRTGEPSRVSAGSGRTGRVDRAGVGDGAGPGDARPAAGVDVLGVEAEVPAGAVEQTVVGPEALAEGFRVESRVVVVGEGGGRVGAEDGDGVAGVGRGAVPGGRVVGQVGEDPGLGPAEGGEVAGELTEGGAVVGSEVGVGPADEEGIGAADGNEGVEDEGPIGGALLLPGEVMARVGDAVGREGRGGEGGRRTSIPPSPPVGIDRNLGRL